MCLHVSRPYCIDSILEVINITKQIGFILGQHMLMNIGYTIFDRHAKDGGVHSFLNRHDFLLCFFADFAVIGCFAHVWKILSVFYFVKVMGIIDRNSFFNPSAPTPPKARGRRGFAAHAQDAPKPKEYPFGPDSERKDSVPQGQVTKHVWKSTVFPKSIREYFVYVPAQYDPQGSEKAAVMVFQDGHADVDEKQQVRVPVVLDNLIAAKDLPVMIGIFINPGCCPEELKEPQQWEAPQGVGIEAPAAVVAPPAK